MLIRLLLVALVACLSLPAMAAPACHAPEAAAVEQHGHHAPSSEQEDRAAPAHMCIGCIPPASRLSATGELLAPVAMPAHILSDDMADGRAILPVLPPPRSFT